MVELTKPFGKYAQSSNWIMKPQKMGWKSYKNYHQPGKNIFQTHHFQILKKPQVPCENFPGCIEPIWEARPKRHLKCIGPFSRPREVRPGPDVSLNGPRLPLMYPIARSHLRKRVRYFEVLFNCWLKCSEISGAHGCVLMCFSIGSV